MIETGMLAEMSRLCVALLAASGCVAAIVGCALPAEGSPAETIASHLLDSTEQLELTASTAEAVEVGGRAGLRLEGLLLVPEVERQDVAIEVDILAEQPSYPGVVLRFQDVTTYELAYAVPHASDLPDTIQYDPVFNGSNTWQVHNGAPYQQKAHLEMGKWFTLRVDAVGSRMMIQVDEQPPLVVERLAHEARVGRVGLWCFRTAVFRNLKVVEPRDIDGTVGAAPTAPETAITEWSLEGVGAVAAEPNGVLNLSRFLPAGSERARLSRRFRLGTDGQVELGLGFSDQVELRLDGELLFEGSLTFEGFETLAQRGWIEPGTEQMTVPLEAGEHELEMTLVRTELFGWGQITTLKGPGLELLPVR